jgi:hypothetical protein
MKMEKVVSWSYDVLAGYIFYGCDIQDGRISDVVTTYLACHMQLTSYDLFSAPRVVRQQGRICEIRPFTVTHYFVSNMEKRLQKSVIFKLQSNDLM